MHSATWKARLWLQPYKTLPTTEPIAGYTLGFDHDTRRGKYMLVATLLSCVAFVAGYAGAMLNRPQGGQTLHGFQRWRPSLDELKRRPIRFDGRFYATNQYRGPPSSAIDAAWDRFTTSEWVLGTAVVLNVSETEVDKSTYEKETDALVKLDDANGGGLMGTIELFHQLHCLNVLRKWTYLEYYAEIDPFFQHPGDHPREHTDHCIDMLRQALMCSGDTGLIAFYWNDSVALPVPSFDNMHFCRDEEQILDWANRNAAKLTGPIRKNNP